MVIMLFIAWGWVLLLILAAAAALNLSRKAGLPLAGVLLLLALPWFWGMRSATFGIRHASVFSPAGHEAWIDHTGFWTYTISVRRGGRIHGMDYLGGQDEPPLLHVRWINDALLAVDREGPNDFVYDLDIYDYVVAWQGLGERGPKPNFDPTSTRPWRRDPLAKEAAFFTD